ncbi:hypothetical protein [Streptomyces alanosinicus]|uniref:Tetratricopeptide repeat protein n=1 Tax=Streptomyces alanosinicus TaxID=68171 RepID=A0A918YKR8_9ACTN|nr:hypothetical protein [Streptomyces alanosinicus]GHE07322.1 hypothetical protein GCM10010339_51950 [Streptomyces alanosinicus]
MVNRLTHAWAVAGRKAWDRAEPLARRTVQDAEQIFGDRHPRTLGTDHPRTERCRTILSAVRAALAAHPSPDSPDTSENAQ